VLDVNVTHRGTDEGIQSSETVLETLGKNKSCGRDLSTVAGKHATNADSLRLIILSPLLAI
jgi:hypothetical protein